jgi:hypothetical protein
VTTFEAPGDDEPREEDLPPKPPVEDLPGEEGDDPPAEEPEVEDSEFMADNEARDDDTVDNEEADAP